MWPNAISVTAALRSEDSFGLLTFQMLLSFATSNVGV